MICAHCGAESDSEPCPACGESPLLDGRYRLLEDIGHGAMGTTYRAERLEDGEVFAVKELLVRRVDSAKTMNLFEREASILQSLDHYGVPDYVDDFVTGEGKQTGFYLVQELVEGETLADELKHRQFTEEDVIDVVEELLGILAYLHGLNPPVVHRDIKPSNVMRRKGDDSLVLVDFGSVRQALATRVKSGSTVTGTAGYMAPEQLMGRAQPASDIYGLAATAIALLTRTEPHELVGSDGRLHWREAVDLSPPLRVVLREMLEPNPEQRASDANALAARLETLELDGDVASPDAESEALARGMGGVPAEVPKWYLLRHEPDAYSRPISLSVSAGMIATTILGFIIFSRPLPILVKLVAFAVGEAGIIALCRVMWRAMSKRRRKLEELFESGERTSAVVTAAILEEKAMGKPLAVLRYEFNVDGRYVEGRYETPDPAVARHERGEEITVVYASDDPEDNVPWI